MLKQALAAIFKSVFKDKIEDFEKRITSLESKLEFQNEKIAENKSDIKETNRDLNSINQSATRVEAVVNTMIELSKQKVLNENNGK